MSLNRTLAPTAFPITRIELMRPEYIAFDNGIQGYLFQANDQELLRLEWIFDNQYERTENNWNHLATAQLLLEGTLKHNSAQIAHMIDYYGAFLIPEYSYDTTSLTLYCLRKHLTHLLPIVMEILQQANFPEEEIQTFIRNNIQKLQVSLQKNDFVARRKLLGEVFGQTRYGLSPKLEDYQGLDVALLKTLFTEQFATNKCTLVLAGNWSKAHIDVLRKSMEEGWNRISAIRKPTIPVFPEVITKELQLEYKPDAMQSAIRLGQRCMTRNHADFPGFQLVSTLFGGYFGSRLMSNIREDKGYTYGIHSGIVPMRHSGLWSIATEVGVTVTGATLHEIRIELDRLHQEFVDPEELNLVKNYMAGSFVGSLENVFSHADRFKNAHLSGLDLSYYDRYQEQISSIGPSEVMAIAQEYFKFDSLCKVVVGQLPDENML